MCALSPRTACHEAVVVPEDGFLPLSECLPRVSPQSRRPCNFCFPDTSSYDEIELPDEQLLVSPNRPAVAIHRCEDSGEIEYRNQGNSHGREKTLAEKVRDGEFQASGGDA